jgi:dCTP deaminase
LQRTYEEIKNDPRVGSEEEEAFKILPNTTANVLKELKRKQRKIDFSILLILVLTTLVLAALSTNFIQPIIAVLTNLISTALIGIFIWFSK